MLNIHAVFPPLAWFDNLDSITKATWIIAAATLLNLWVYWRMSGRMKAQIDQVEKQLDLTIELNRPRLAATINTWTWDPITRCLAVNIIARNFGNTTARDVRTVFALKCTAGGSGDFGHSFAQTIVHPNDSRQEHSVTSFTQEVCLTNEFVAQAMLTVRTAASTRSHTTIARIIAITESSTSSLPKAPPALKIIALPRRSERTSPRGALEAKNPGILRFAKNGRMSAAHRSPTPRRTTSKSPRKRFDDRCGAV